MINEEQARLWLRKNARSHLPATARIYRSRVVTLSLPTSTIGLQVDHQPFAGHVICVTPEFVVVKLSGNMFVLADPTLFAEPLVEGSKVQVTPYQRRQFDGKTFSEPTIEQYIGGQSSVYRIGQIESEIPLPREPQTQYMTDMLVLLHRGKCPDGVRVISNMLVDFNARNIDFQEPDFSNPEDERDPQFSFDCDTGKFTGRVVVGLNIGEDAYYVELFKSAEGAAPVLAHKCSYVMFDELASVLTTLLCDGKWAKAKVAVLKPAPKTKLLPAAEATV